MQYDGNTLNERGNKRIRKKFEEQIISVQSVEKPLRLPPEQPNESMIK
jgi:hypothetical protein